MIKKVQNKSGPHSIIPFTKAHNTLKKGNALIILTSLTIRKTLATCNQAGIASPCPIGLRMTETKNPVTQINNESKKFMVFTVSQYRGYHTPLNSMYKIDFHFFYHRENLEK